MPRIIKKKIPNLDGYKADNFGNIWSYRKKTPKILKPGKTSNGYLYFHPGFKRQFSVSRAVLMAFKGLPPSDKYQVCHIDGIKSNNIPSNLKWGTQSDNEKDKIRHGTMNFSNICKINKQIADLIRIRRRNGERAKDLAKEYNMEPGNIWYITSGKIWK